MNIGDRVRVAGTAHPWYRVVEVRGNLVRVTPAHGYSPWRITESLRTGPYGRDG